MFNNRYRLLGILALSILTFIGTVLCEVYYYFRIEIEWYYALATIFSITWLIWEGNRLIERPIKRVLAKSKKTSLLLSFFAAGNVITLVSCMLVVWLVGNVFHGRTAEDMKNPLKLNLIYGGLVNLLFHLLNAIFFYFNELRLGQAEAEELRRNNERAQLQLIRSQINPHFLFNNLNVLAGMVIKDNPRANHFIEEFSKVYRYILKNQEQHLIDLNKELEFIEPYLYLLRTRFGEGLVVDIEVPDEYRSRYIVPASVQMLIENAIKHNVVSQNRPLKIRIRAEGPEELQVINNLQIRTSEEPGTKTGLANIAKRYQIISNKDLIIQSSASEFKVTIPLLAVN